jgi:hypothetical protein
VGRPQAITSERNDPVLAGTGNNPAGATNRSLSTREGWLKVESVEDIMWKRRHGPVSHVQGVEGPETVTHHINLVDVFNAHILYQHLRHKLVIL